MDSYSDLPQPFRPRHDGPRRTQHSHPYSYDPFMLCGRNTPTNGGCYSDRLYQWDHAKTEECAKKHLGRNNQYDNLKKTQDFLRDLLDHPELDLAYVIQMCNRSTGYPVWYFGYNTPQEKNEQ